MWCGSSASGPGRGLAGLAGCAVVALGGVWAAVLWHRLGEVGLAVTLCGWPVCSPRRCPGCTTSSGWSRSRSAWSAGRVAVAGPAGCRTSGMLVLGWVFVGWVAAAPRGLTDETRRLPNGADVELDWSWFEHLLASVTAVVGVAFLVAAIFAALRATPALRITEQPADRGSVRGSEGSGDPRMLPGSVSGGSRPRGS